MSSTDQLVESLFDLWRWLRHMSNAIRQGDITREQFWLLHQLRRRGSLTISEVAETVGITQSTATTACKRLEAAGLISRSRRSDDERVVEVSLTERGRTTVEGWRRRRREAVAELLAPLSEPERDELQRLIQLVLKGTGVSTHAPGD
jgi:DNA-binding MarR family transcriptional regulator